MQVLKINESDCVLTLTSGGCNSLNLCLEGAGQVNAFLLLQQQPPDMSQYLQFCLCMCPASPKTLHMLLQACLIACHVSIHVWPLWKSWLPRMFDLWLRGQPHDQAFVHLFLADFRAK